MPSRHSEPGAFSNFDFARLLVTGIARAAKGEVMAAPVWVLSVDLQTKTATFQSGMADAAKSARSAFTDIKSGAGDMADATGNSFGSVRNKIGLLDNSIRGNHAAAMADLIHMFSQTTVVMNALPLLATAGGFILLGGVIFEAAKALKEWHEASQKLKDEQTDFGTAIQNVFNGLDEKLLQAGIRSDELRNDHLGALRKELKLIDEQSMNELVRAFGEIDKAADVLFGDLKTHWYQMGIGSEGAQHALVQFKTQYDSLLAQGKDTEATDLLKGTLGSAEKVMAAMKAAAATPAHTELGVDNTAAVMEHYKAMQVLQAAGVGYTDKEVASQKALVDALSAQVAVEEKVHALKTVQSGNATKSFDNEGAAQAAAAAREAAEHTAKMGELALAAEKEQAQVSATIHAASIQARLAEDIQFADKERDIELQKNAGLIAALDKSGKDYNNQLKALRDQAAEIEAQHANAVAALRGKAAVEQYQKDLADMQEGEREKIDATQQGSAARLAAIDAAIAAEDKKNLQATEHYRELLTQRVEVVRQMAEQEAKAQADAGKEAADNEAKMGELSLAAWKEKVALQDSAMRVSREMRMNQEMDAANQELALKLTAISQQIAALDKGGKEYENKLRELQDKELQLTQEHENEITAIKDKSAMDQNQKQLAALTQFEQMTASGLAQVLMGHKSFANMMDSIGNQIVSGMLQTALMSIMTADMDKERQAASAARTMFLAGAKFPFPANIVAAPVMAAAAFASVMAFEEGGVVPGVGKGDIVPAMLEPGEGVIKNSAMDKLNRGEMGNTTVQHVVHLHMAHHVQALDASGMDKVLQKHATLIQKHVGNELRKMNR